MNFLLDKYLQAIGSKNGKHNSRLSWGDSRNFRHWGFRGILIAASVLCLSGCTHKDTSDTAADSQNVPTVSVAKADLSTIINTVQVSGTLAPIPGREAALVPQVSGTLISMSAQLGQPVSAGQVVAQISPALIQGQIQQARATLSQNEVQVQQAKANYIQQTEQTKTSILQAGASVRNAQATLEADKATLTGDNAAFSNAQSTLTREKNLFTSGLAPQKDIDSAVLAVQTAQAQVNAQIQTVSAQEQTVAGQKQALEAAKAQSLSDQVKRSDISVAKAQVSSASGALNALETQEALYTIRSPIAGYPTMIGASVGSTVDNTTKLITITDTRMLQVQLAIPTTDAPKIHLGQSVAFTVEAIPGKTFYSTIDSISTQVDAASGTLQALATIANPKGVLKNDMAISAQITTDKKVGVIAVPDSAVLVDADTGESSVDTIDDKNVLRVVPVKTGLKAGGKTEILSGLKGGEEAATAGQFGLTDGSTVKIADSGSAK